MKNKYAYYFILLLFITSYSACKQKEKVASENKAAIRVSVAKVSQNDIKEYLRFNGVTQFQKKENIRSNVTGYISMMKFNIGDPIQKGQIFALVRTKEQDALREALKIDSSLAKFVHPITIRSNVTGFFTGLNISQNDYVAEGDILATIVQPKSLVVMVHVPFEYEAYVKEGTICVILLQNGERISAKISGVLPTIDVTAQSQPFLITLPNVNLPENLNVQIQIVTREALTAMTVPKIALQTNELLTAYWVMKVVNDSIAIQQKVTPLLENDSLVQIQTNELKVNDRVITEGAYQMQDSTIISIK